jgi:hypothetical protein
LPAACRELTPLDKYFDSRPFLFWDVVTLRVRNVGSIILKPLTKLSDK